MDVEKTIEFILEQQAQFVVRVQQLGEAQANLAAAMMREIDPPGRPRSLISSRSHSFSRTFPFLKMTGQSARQAAC